MGWELKRKIKMVHSVLDSQYTPVFPVTDDEEIDFDILDCVASGSDVNIVDDEELDSKAVIELTGNDARITFFVNSSMPLLVFHINACNRFVTLSLFVQDDCGIDRTIEFSSKRSIVQVEQNTAKIPLEIGDGWQRLCINIDDILSHSFGARLGSFIEMTLSGGCRFSKIFFQEEDFADIQLPTFLRVANTRTK